MNRIVTVQIRLIDEVEWVFELNDVGLWQPKCRVKDLATNKSKEVEDASK